MARTRVVVDTSLVGGLNPETRDRMRAEAGEMFERGIREGNETLINGARSLMEQVTSAEVAGPAVSEVPFTAEEETARDAEEAEEAERVTAAEAAAEAEKTTRRRRVALAEKVEGGTATAAERDEAIALALRAAPNETLTGRS